MTHRLVAFFALVFLLLSLSGCACRAMKSNGQVNMDQKACAELNARITTGANYAVNLISAIMLASATIALMINGIRMMMAGMSGNSAEKLAGSIRHLLVLFMLIIIGLLFPRIINIVIVSLLSM